MSPANNSAPGSVLIVDDVPENLSFLSDALDEAGYMVLVATDGRSALERLQHISPDVILLDAVMPGMDGFETCRQIKAKPATRAIPVVFMTGLTESEHVVRGFEVGGTDYVTKPLKPDEVIARVAAHMRNARQISHAHKAIDAVGLAVVVLSPDLTPEWMTPGAEMLLGHDS
ncbi:MAG TPA: response regulator, partial [Burkholderiales bacterium]|nr:response regulator [Burkholderiales bacterium]